MIHKYKILLTGASGFIGKNIVDSYLCEKYSIIAPSHKELDLTVCEDVDNFFLNNDVDYVIHSAVKPGHRNAQNIDDIFYLNSRMFYNLLHNTSRFEKMIYLSSGSVYDMARQNLDKVNEDFFGNLIPQDEHGFFRYVTAKHVEKILNVVELRLFSIYGKYEDYAIRFISNALCKSIFDLPITIKQNRVFNFTYVDDLMPVIEYFIENQATNTSYNVCQDVPFSLLEVAKIVNDVTGKNLPIQISEAGMGYSYSGSNIRLHAEIPSLQLTALREGIGHLYSWYRNNKNLINRKLLLFDK